jgi:hypothetical protein
MRGVRVLERRTTSSLSVSTAIIWLADWGVMKQRRAIAALLDSDSPSSSKASKMAMSSPSLTGPDFIAFVVDDVEAAGACARL